MNNYGNFCTQCGNPLPSGSGFCGKCGNRVNNMVVNSNYNQQSNNFNVNRNKQKRSIGKILIPVLLLFIVAAVVLYMTVFNKETDNKNGRTIMLYMVGSNLESEIGLGTADLKGLDYNKLNANNTKVVAIIGGTKKWNNTYVNSSTTAIYELTDTGFKIVDNTSKKNMGLSSTFSYFLNYVYDNYKTSKYDLVIWDHGAGVLGGELDELTNDQLYLHEYKAGFENGPFKGNNKIETVIFRTCLNGTIEVADIVKNYANYMIASEEVGWGIAIDSVFTPFNDITMKDDIVSLGKKYIDNYMDYVSSLNKYNTYSIIDLSKMNELEDAVNDFFNDLNLSKDYNQIARVRSTIRQFAGTMDKTYDSIDLYNLVDRISSLSPTKAKKVLNIIDKMVLYNSASSSESKGLSIYFPYYGSNDWKDAITNNLYNTFTGLTGYGKFIKNFYSIQINGNKALSFSTNVVDLNTSTDSKESDFTMELTDEQKERFAQARYAVFKKVENDYYIPIYSSNNVKLDGNKLKANIKDRQLRLVDIAGDTAEIYLNETDENDEYIFYETNVIFENLTDGVKMDNGLITFAFNKKTNDISITSTLIGGDNYKSEETSLNIKTPYNVSVDLNNYTNIAFGYGMYKILDENGNYKENWESSGTILGYEPKIKDLKLICEDYKDYNDYYAVYMIQDTNNNIYYSKLIKMGE